jgi:hypothetical protein
MRVSSSATRSATTDRFILYASAKNPRYSRTVSWSYTPKLSGIQPMLDRTPYGSLTGSAPATRTSPRSAFSSDARISNRVVFPAPFGPTSAVT